MAQSTRFKSMYDPTLGMDDRMPTDWSAQSTSLLDDFRGFVNQVREWTPPDPRLEYVRDVAMCPTDDGWVRCVALGPLRLRGDRPQQCVVLTGPVLRPNGNG